MIYAEHSNDDFQIPWIKDTDSELIAPNAVIAGMAETIRKKPSAITIASRSGTIAFRDRSLNDRVVAWLTPSHRRLTVLVDSDGYPDTIMNSMPGRTVRSIVELPGIDPAAVIRTARFEKRTELRKHDGGLPVQMFYGRLILQSERAMIDLGQPDVPVEFVKEGGGTTGRIAAGQLASHLDLAALKARRRGV